MYSLDRRHFLGSSAAVAGIAMIGGRPRFAHAASAASELTPGVPTGVASYSLMGTLPGKKPLIRKTFRPPNYETPVSVFDQALTPNDSFFVRERRHERLGGTVTKSA